MFLSNHGQSTVNKGKVDNNKLKIEQFPINKFELS